DLHGPSFPQGDRSGTRSLRDWFGAKTCDRQRDQPTDGISCWDGKLSLAQNFVVRRPHSAIGPGGADLHVRGGNLVEEERLAPVIGQFFLVAQVCILRQISRAL